MKKLLDFQWSFLTIDIRLKNKTPIVFTERLRTVINLWKTFLQTESFFIVWNEKHNFCFRRKRINGKEVASLQKSSSKNSTEDTKAISNYIYLLQHSVICFDSSIWYQFIATKRNPWVALHFQSTIIHMTHLHCHISTYLAIMLQASWDITKTN